MENKEFAKANHFNYLLLFPNKYLMAKIIRTYFTLTTDMNHYFKWFY